MPYIRCLEWRIFTKLVEQHIRLYTIPQYGDAPDDQLEGWTPEQCVEAIKRYCNRFSSNARGEEETFRDLLKIAHYACVTFLKLHWKLGKTPVLLNRESLKIEKGDLVHK